MQGRSRPLFSHLSPICKSPFGNGGGEGPKFLAMASRDLMCLITILGWTWFFFTWTQRYKRIHGWHRFRSAVHDFSICQALRRWFESSKAKLFRSCLKVSKKTIELADVQVTEGIITVNAWRKSSGNRFWFDLEKVLVIGSWLYLFRVAVDADLERRKMMSSVAAFSVLMSFLTVSPSVSQ